MDEVAFTSVTWLEIFLNVFINKKTSASENYKDK